MTRALAPATRQRALDLARRGWKALPDILRQAREDARSAPEFVKITVRVVAFWFTVSFFLTWLGRFGTGAVIAGAISVAALLALGVMADFWRIGFRWHAQRVLYGWKMLFPSNRLPALPYRRAFVGTGLAFTAPSLYANFRRTATDSKRLSRLVRANRRSGARVFRHHAQAFAEMLVAVPDSELQATMTALVRHAKTDGTAHVARYFSFTPAVALAALDAGIPPEYAVMLPEA